MRQLTRSHVWMPQLRLSTVIAVLALPFSAVLYFGLEIYLANVLGATGFGRYATFTAASGVLVYLVAVGIPNASTKFVAEYQEAGARQLLMEYVWWSLTTGCALAVLVGFPLAFLYCLVASPAELGTVGALAIAGTTLGLFLWLWARQVAIGAGMRLVAVVPKELVFPVLLTLTVAAFTVQTFAGVALAYVILLVIVEASVCVFLLARLGGAPKPTVRHARAGAWIAVALPLGIASLASAGMVRWDVLNASAVLPAEEVAAYAAAARVALVGGIVQRTFEVLSARGLVALSLSASAATVRSSLRAHAASTGAVSALLLVAVFILAENILRMFGAFAVEGVTALRILVVAQFVHCVTAPYDVYMSVGELQKPRATLLVGASIAALALTALGTRTFGITGCAVGVLVSVAGYRIWGVVLTEHWLGRDGGAA